MVLPYRRGRRTFTGKLRPPQEKWKNVKTVNSNCHCRVSATWPITNRHNSSQRYPERLAQTINLAKATDRHAPDTDEKKH